MAQEVRLADSVHTTETRMSNAWWVARDQCGPLRPLTGVAALSRPGELGRYDTRTTSSRRTALRWAALTTAMLTATAACALSAPRSDGVAPTPTEAPQRIEVMPLANDSQIAARLTRILQATGWFEAIDVRVNQGVVFLDGQAVDPAHGAWAEQLARNTRDVVAVVNQIEVAPAAVWNFTPAAEKLRELSEGMIRRGPVILIAILLLIATWYIAKWSVRAAASVLGRALDNKLLRDVAARVVAVPVFMLGLYVVLTVSGLTGLAVTVVGGTGLVGLVIGFAFRDIAENFLASVLISMQRPFAPNDLIEVAGHRGFVQSVNPRSTLLMTEAGNHVQIPNATIYKATIQNFTANPIARYDFTVGIGYDDPIANAQSVAMRVLTGHPAVLDDPEPLVLVEALGAATVNLRIYFWIDTRRYSYLKVRSALIRLTKRAFGSAGISMPDEAREVIFPQGVPIQTMTPGRAEAVTSAPLPSPSAIESGSAASSTEGALTSEAEEIKRQARESRAPEGGTNLLES